MKPIINEHITPWLTRNPFEKYRGVLAFSIPFGIYVLTLAPTIYNLDSAEFTTAAATLGITRSTGYPLYILLGHLWSHLPIGDVGYRLNLFSAFNGALTIVLLDRIFRRLGISTWASLGALGILGFSYYWWALSLIAEVYTLHLVLVAATILLLLKCKDTPGRKNLILLGLIIGCSFGNHLSTLLLIPAYLFYFISNMTKKDEALYTGLGFLAGTSVYLYLPIRSSMSPPFNYAGYYDANGTFQPFDLSTFQDLIWLVSGKRFIRLMFAYDIAGYQAEVLQFIKLLWNAFLGIGIGPGIVGLFSLMRSHWKLGVMSVLLFLGHGLFYTSYRAVDKELMFLPCFLTWTLWLAAGFQWIFKILNDINNNSSAKIQQISLTVTKIILLATVIFAATRNWPYVDQSKNWSAREHGEMILSDVKPGALVIGNWNTIPVIEYLQLVEGQRKDVKAINRFLIPPENLLQIIANQIDQRPIYIDYPPIELLSTYDIRKDGRIYLVSME